MNKSTATSKPEIGKTYEKFFATKTKIVDVEGAKVQAIMSSEDEDRDGDIIRVSGWVLDHFLKHPVLIADHNYEKITNQIGYWEDVHVEGKKLVGIANYYINKGNAMADWAYFLASQGSAAFSVGFIPLSMNERKDKKPERPRGAYGWEFLKQEMLETSQVTIPSNPAALQLAAKLAKSNTTFKDFFNIYNEENKELLLNMEMDNMEDNCKCFACEAETTVGIHLCLDHMKVALDPINKGSAIYEIKGTEVKEEVKGTDAVEIKEIEGVLLESVDIEVTVKNALKSMLIECGFLNEDGTSAIASFIKSNKSEEKEEDAKSEDSEEVKAESDEKAEDSDKKKDEKKDLGEDSIAEGGALVPEVDAVSEKEAKSLDDEESESKSFDTDIILKEALEAIFVKK